MGEVINFSKSAIDSQGGSSSRLIASLDNVNFKNVLPNLIDWVNGMSAANIANPMLFVEWVSGVYTPKVVTQGSATITLTGTTSATDEVVQLFVGASLAATYFASIGDSLETIKAGLIAGAFDEFVIENLSGDIMTVTEPLGSEGDYNGELLTFSVGGTGFGSTGGTEIEGGIPQATNFELQLDSAVAYLGDGVTIINAVQSIDTTRSLSVAITANGDCLFSKSGQFAIPVITGTQDDFICNFKIYGDPIE